MSADVDSRFLTEGYIWAALFFIAFSLFVVQLLFEVYVRRLHKKRKDEFKQASAMIAKGELPRVGKLQFSFHRIGFAITLLGVVHMAVDPYGYYNIYPYGISLALSRNRSCLLLWAAGLAFHMPIELLYRVSLNRRPPRRYKYVMYGGVLLTHITSNVDWIIVLAAEQYRALEVLVLFTFAYANISLIISMILGMAAFRVEISRMEAASAQMQMQELPARATLDNGADSHSGEDVRNVSVTVRNVSDDTTAGTSGPPPLPPQHTRNVSDSANSLISPNEHLPGHARTPSTNSSPSLKTRSRKPTMPGIRNTLRKPLRLMTIFGIVCTMAMVASAVLCINEAVKLFRRPLDQAPKADYSTWFLSLECMFNIVHVVCSFLGLWYSWMPLPSCGKLWLLLAPVSGEHSNSTDSDDTPVPAARSTDDA